MTMALTQLTIGDARFRAGRWQGRADLATLVPLSGAQTLDRESLSTARNILRNQGFQAVVTSAVAPPERAAFLLDDFSEREHLHLLRYDLPPRFADSRPDRTKRSDNSDRANRPDNSNRSGSPDNSNRSGSPDNSGSSGSPDNSGSSGSPDNSGSSGSPDNSGSSGSQLLKSWQRIRPWHRPRPRIRRGTSRDWDDVLTLDRQSFDEFWHFDRDGLQDSIEATAASRLRIIRRFDVAEPPDTNERTDDNNQIVGYALAGHSGRTGYLQRLAVHPAHRQQGIATLLVNDALLVDPPTRSKDRLGQHPKNQQQRSAAIQKTRVHPPRTAPDSHVPNTHMIGRARIAAALAALVLVPLAAITNLTGAAAQNDGRIDLVAQTAFVGDDPATIDLRVIAPADSTIRIQIFEARTTREDIRSSYTGLGEQRPFSNFICDVDEPLDEAHCQLNSTKEIFSIEIPDEEIGEILRINQGALPVVITLEDNNGEVIDTLITHLLVLEEQRRPTLHVAFIADLSAPLAIQPDQTINLDTQNLFARAERIAERNEIPITVALQPETLQALAISSSEQLTEFAKLLSDRPVLNAPWVDLDEEAWRLTGDTTLIADQYSYGADVISEMLGRGPTNNLQTRCRRNDPKHWH